ncbi:cupin-like domain containing protein [Nitzschia inconspicua]|uniref:Cupin-like domain containing protein n=1 Tax=Nitzschia inconspicua TaxID=303405 RepID=A0A9K3K9W6_9STRA|nr:cupin-like domain containing protein [Nitzschia inconspicua]KAG7362449.1 cupin-like domain containing protein [Nitzschia inconspicua]
MKKKQKPILLQTKRRRQQQQQQLRQTSSSFATLPLLVVPMFSCMAIVCFVVTSFGLYYSLLTKESSFLTFQQHSQSSEQHYPNQQRHQRRKRNSVTTALVTLPSQYEQDHPMSILQVQQKVQQMRLTFRLETILSVDDTTTSTSTNTTITSSSSINNINNNDNNNNPNEHHHHQQQQHDHHHRLPLSYSIHQCPPEIPVGYPYTWNLVQVLRHWHPDDTNIPTNIHQGLCSIDWNDPTQHDIATRYQQAEVPFLLYNHPDLVRAAERWNQYRYMDTMLAQEKSSTSHQNNNNNQNNNQKHHPGQDQYRPTYRNEHSNNNHMMYWKLRNNIRGPDPPVGWKPPTDDVELTFPQWYHKAIQMENSTDMTQQEHYYLRLNGVPDGTGQFLYDELPLFRPNQDHTSTLFMVSPNEARGINCRLGSKGTIAELHYDQSRNWITILKGYKRYILAHPNQCRNMKLYPMGHPSARHSSVNWSDPEQWTNNNNNHQNQQFQSQSHSFATAQVNEVVLQPGDGLYLPTYWFHFIVSLTINYQCNARSGTTYENQRHISQCGF